MFDEYDTDRTTTTPDERKAAYLQMQLSDASYRKQNELSEHFKLDLQAAPRSPAELIQWAKDGWFKYNSCAVNEDGSWKDENSARWQPPASYILWDNPNRDTSGYYAAYKKLDDATRKAERLITVGTPAEGLKALEEFEATTFH